MTREVADDQCWHAGASGSLFSVPFASHITVHGDVALHPFPAHGLEEPDSLAVAGHVQPDVVNSDHDPDTGEELWRTSTIALPGDPNSATWGNLAPEFRAGSVAWIPGSYDPELKLFYIGTAQAKPWVPASRGMTALDAALYTNTTLALDPKTGKMIWYFQHIPGESLDMDVVYERFLIDIDGEKLFFTVGKDGILWKLGRRTGQYVDLTETVYQDVYARVNRESGRLTYRTDILEAQVGQLLRACPANFGGHDWQASARAAGQQQDRCLPTPS